MSGSPTTPLSLKHLPRRLYTTAALSHRHRSSASYSHHSPHPPPPISPSTVHRDASHRAHSGKSRYLYTTSHPSISSSSGTNGFFDPGAPPPPPSRPSYVRIARGEVEGGGGSSSSGTSGTSHGQGNSGGTNGSGNASGGNSGQSGSTHPSLAFTAPPPGESISPASNSSAGSSSNTNTVSPSSSVGQHYFNNSQPAELSSEHTDGSASHRRRRKLTADAHKYTLDVGAYGIPKKHPHSTQQRSLAYNTSNGFAGSSSRAFHSTASSAPTDGELVSVQVGEDAYFIRSDALGVADGVGGWEARSRRRSGSSPGK